MFRYAALTGPCIVCIADGMEEVPEQYPDGMTPLRLAHTPTIDAIARNGKTGRFTTIPHGFAPDSDVGNMSLLGYDPQTYHTGRGPVEAAAIGLFFPFSESSELSALADPVVSDATVSDATVSGAAGSGAVASDNAISDGEKIAPVGPDDLIWRVSLCSASCEPVDRFDSTPSDGSGSSISKNSRVSESITENCLYPTAGDCHWSALHFRDLGMTLADDAAQSIITMLNRALVKAGLGEQFQFFSNEGFRHILVQRGGATRPEGEMLFKGPHQLLHVPLGEAYANYPDDIRRVLDCARTALRGSADSQISTSIASQKDEVTVYPYRGPYRGPYLGPYNGPYSGPCPDVAWLWGQGRALSLPSFAAQTNKQACMITGVSVVAGLACAAGMRVVQNPAFTGDADTDYAGKAQAAREFLEQGGDIAFIHVEAPDWCAHEGDPKGKQQAIERIDADILGPLRRALPHASMIVTSDHLASAMTRTHERGPVGWYAVEGEEGALEGVLPEALPVGSFSYND